MNFKQALLVHNIFSLLKHMFMIALYRNERQIEILDVCLRMWITNKQKYWLCNHFKNMNPYSISALYPENPLKKSVGTPMRSMMNNDFSYKNNALLLYLELGASYSKI